MENSMNRAGRRNFGNVNSSAVARNSGPNRSGTGSRMLRTPMSRGSFVRGAGLAAGSALAAGLGLGGVARATGGISPPIHGQNNPAIDVPAVQAAVADFDVVNLVGEFDFGEHKQHVECTDPDDIFTCRYVVDQQGGTVNITKNVKIYGLNDVNNNPPKIKNGFAPISCNTKVELTVSNIHFEGPTFAAILAYKSNGLEVSMCNIKDVKSSELRRGYVTGAFGIALTTDSAHNGLWDFDEIEGTVTIRENYIENMDIESFSPYHIPTGIHLAFNKADATISGNQIYDCASGVYVSSVEGNTTITDNIIHPGQLGIWAGITVEWFDIIPFTPGNTYISGNEVYCAHNTADGIVFENFILSEENYPITATMVVTNNHVTMENTDYGALTCYGPGVNSIWTNNIVKGSMGWTIGILPYYADYGITAENNVFKGNNISQANASWAHVVFDAGARYNTVIGKSGTVADLSDNTSYWIPDYDGDCNPTGSYTDIYPIGCGDAGYLNGNITQPYDWDRTVMSPPLTNPNDDPNCAGEYYIFVPKDCNSKILKKNTITGFTRMHLGPESGRAIKAALARKRLLRKQ